MLGYCDKMESMLHLSMHTSLFFRGMHFETHTLNLFGINTNNLVEFRTAKSISDSQLQKTSLAALANKISAAYEIPADYPFD